MKRIAGLLTAAVLLSAAALGQGLPILEESEQAPLLTMFNDSPPSMADQRLYPENPYADESLTVSVRVYADPHKASLPVRDVKFWYKCDHGDWITMPMLEVVGEEDRYFATITPEPGTERILYRIVATDTGGGMSVAMAPVEAVDLDDDDEFVWVKDRLADDEVVPAEIDIAAVGLAMDAENLYVIQRMRGKPGPGSMTGAGANLYLAPIFPPTEGLSAFLGGQGKILAYAPMAAAMLGIPRFGLFNMPDLVAAFTGGAQMPPTNVKMKLGDDRLSFTVPLEEMGEGDEFVTGLVTMKYNPAVGQPAPWDASPYIRLIFRGGVIELRSSDAGAPVRAGVSSVDITPPVGAPFAGYGDRVGVPSEGVHDPLLSNTLLLESEGRYYALVGTDLFYMRMMLYDEIALRVRARIGLPEESLFIGASHSHHSFGALIPELALLAGPFDPEIFDSTVDAIAAGIEEAYNNLAPARIGVGWIETEEGRHMTGNRVKRDGARDTVIGVIRVDDLDGNPVATLFNASGHPTSISSRTMLFSSDFVGPARDAVAQNGGGLGIFFNGSVGDHSMRNPVEVDGDEFEKAAVKGQALAEYVIEAREAIQTSPEAKLRGFTQWMILNRSMWWPSQIRGLLIDDAFAFVSSPGEMFFDDLGLTLRQLGQDKGLEQVFVLALTNDGLGYIYPEELYYQHAYEASYTAFGPKMSPFIKENLDRLVARMAAVR